MVDSLRSRALVTLFGGGLGGTAAQAAVEWLSKEVAAALGRTPEVLDVSRLEPGETYTVTVRPPLTAAERTARARREKLSRKLGDSTRPGRSTLRTARKLAKTQRRLDRRRLTRRTRARLERRERALGERFDRVTALSPKQERMAGEIARLDADIEQLRAASLESVRRRPRRRSTRLLP